MSDDKTRILTPAAIARIDQAARPGDRTAAAAAGPRQPASREPQFVGDKIFFFCPNGHRLTVAAANAGRRGHCDKTGCGAPVVIPTPPTVRASVPEPEILAPAAEPEPPAVEAAEEAGETPPLELTFEPPGEDAEAAVAEEEPPALPGEPPPVTEDAPVMDTASQAERDAGEAFAEALARGEDNLPALLMNRLWLETRHSQAVQMELHLTNGNVIRPTEYDPGWSQGKLGLFAAEATDGSVTITAVAWDAIQRIVVHKVNGWPPDMFPETDAPA